MPFHSTDALPHSSLLIYFHIDILLWVCYLYYLFLSSFIMPLSPLNSLSRSFNSQSKFFSFFFSQNKIIFSMKNVWALIYRWGSCLWLNRNQIYSHMNLQCNIFTIWLSTARWLSHISTIYTYKLHLTCWLSVVTAVTYRGDEKNPWAHECPLPCGSRTACLTWWEENIFYCEAQSDFVCWQLTLSICQLDPLHNHQVSAAAGSWCYRDDQVNSWPQHGNNK